MNNKVQIIQFIKIKPTNRIFNKAIYKTNSLINLLSFTARGILNKFILLNF